MTTLKQIGFVKNFVCLGDQCEDTCCKGWGMQVDVQTVKKYENEAPELRDAVTSGEAEHIMKRDPDTDYCVKFDAGWCGIHKTRGSDFLGDACHFYPRITRGVGETNIMSASLSCPEVVRLTMQPDAFEFYDTAIDRLPNSLKEYLPGGMNAEDALKVHQAFVRAALDPAISAERAFSSIASVSRSLQSLPQTSWPAAVAFYLQNAASRLPKPEGQAADMFNLLHALCGLVAAAKKSNRPRLMQTINDMEQALKVRLDWERVGIVLTQESEGASQKMLADCKASYAPKLDSILKKWLAAELSMAFYPFSGFGETLIQRITTLGVRFAITKLALISAWAINKRLAGQEVVSIQSLSRFLDHLADPALLLSICEETGWVREARMRALVGDD